MLKELLELPLCQETLPRLSGDDALVTLCWFSTPFLRTMFLLSTAVPPALAPGTTLPMGQAGEGPKIPEYLNFH